MIKVMSARSYNPYMAFDSQDTFGTRRSRNLLNLLVFDRALQTQESLLMAEELL
jgi:hypothetical protein